jgi:hypothetical protein
MPIEVDSCFLFSVGGESFEQLLNERKRRRKSVRGLIDLVIIIIIKD